MRGSDGVSLLFSKYLNVLIFFFSLLLTPNFFSNSSTGNCKNKTNNNHGYRHNL